MAFTLGSVLSGAGKILGGIIKASPIGTAITTAQSVLRPKAPTGPTVLGNLPAVFTGQKPTGGVIPAGAGGGGAVPQLPPIPGTTMVRTSSGPFGDVTGGSSSTAPGTSIGPSGYGHYSRTGKWIRTTRTGKQIRRVNPMNVRAAKRAVRRLEGGEKLLRRIFNVRHGKAPARITVKRK